MLKAGETATHNNGPVRMLYPAPTDDGLVQLLLPLVGQGEDGVAPVLATESHADQRPSLVSWNRGRRGTGTSHDRCRGWGWMGPNKHAYESFADRQTGAVEVPVLPTIDAGGGVRWDPDLIS